MAANSETQSLWESLGVRAAYISWIVRGFSPPICLLHKLGHAEVLKKTPSSAKYVTCVRPPSVPECPPPPPPGFTHKHGKHLNNCSRTNQCFVGISLKKRMPAPVSFLIHFYMRAKLHFNRTKIYYSVHE